jgi:hypothetical protein
MTQNGKDEKSEPKIRVLETKMMEFEGELEPIAVPTRIDIKGKSYDVELYDYGGEVRDASGSPLSLEQLQNVKLGDIPDFLNIWCEAPDSLGQLRLCPTGFAELEIMHRAKYYRGYLPIDCYFKALKKFAVKNGFETVHNETDNDYYFLNIGKMFQKDTLITEVFKAFQPIATGIKEIESRAEKAIKSILESMDGQS